MDPGDEAVDQAVRAFLARGTGDPEGAPVGFPVGEERVRGSHAPRPPTPSPTRTCASRCWPSPRSGAAPGPSAASRWRWTRPSRYPDTVLVGRRSAPDGSVGGFLQLVAVSGQRGLLALLDAAPEEHAERADGVPDPPRWSPGRATNVTEVSLNFSAFADFLRRRRGCERLHPLGSMGGWPKADRLFQLERLHSFNRKFFPRTGASRRYFCFERWSDLPLAGARLPARRVAARLPGPLGLVGGGPRSALRKVASLFSAPRGRLAAWFVPAVSKALSGAPNTDWGRFGYDARATTRAGMDRDHGGEPRAVGRRQVQLDGTVDSSPIHVHDVSVGGQGRESGRHDDLRSHRGAQREHGSVIWRFTPPATAPFAGPPRSQPTPPVADPSRTAVYASAPDGGLASSRSRPARCLDDRDHPRPDAREPRLGVQRSRGLLIVTIGGYTATSRPIRARS